MAQHGVQYFVGTTSQSSRRDSLVYPNPKPQSPGHLARECPEGCSDQARRRALLQRCCDQGETLHARRLRTILHVEEGTPIPRLDEHPRRSSLQHSLDQRPHCLIQLLRHTSLGHHAQGSTQAVLIHRITRSNQTDNKHSQHMKTDIHYLCKTNLGLLLLSSSERCFLARGWRRELLFPYNNAKTQTE